MKYQTSSNLQLKNNWLDVMISLAEKLAWVRCKETDFDVKIPRNCLFLDIHKYLKQMNHCWCDLKGLKRDFFLLWIKCSWIVGISCYVGSASPSRDGNVRIRCRGQKNTQVLLEAIMYIFYIYQLKRLHLRHQLYNILLLSVKPKIVNIPPPSGTCETCFIDKTLMRHLIY